MSRLIAADPFLCPSPCQYCKESFCWVQAENFVLSRKVGELVLSGCLHDFTWINKGFLNKTKSKASDSGWSARTNISYSISAQNLFRRDFKKLHMARAVWASLCWKCYPHDLDKEKMKMNSTWKYHLWQLQNKIILRSAIRCGCGW